MGFPSEKPALTFEMLSSLVLPKGASLVPTVPLGFTPRNITTWWQAKRECTRLSWWKNLTRGMMQQ